MRFAYPPYEVAEPRQYILQGQRL